MRGSRWNDLVWLFDWTTSAWSFGWEGVRSQAWKREACLEPESGNFPPRWRIPRHSQARRSTSTCSTHFYKIALHIHWNWDIFMLKCIYGALENNVLWSVRGWIYFTKLCFERTSILGMAFTSAPCPRSKCLLDTGRKMRNNLWL